MSMAIAHFAFGAAITTLLATFLVPTIWYPRTVTLAGGSWAMIPDFHWVSPIARRQFYAFHSSQWADLFWFHRTLDRLDPSDSKTVAAVCLAFFILTTALAEWRNYRAPPSVKAAYQTHIERNPPE